MASSNHGSAGTPADPARSPGRGFASVDPERQCEIPVNPSSHGSPDKGNASGQHPQPAIPGRPARPAGTGHPMQPQDTDDEGGSGRRHG